MLANKEYKDSGIVWLGHIPAHWDVTNYRRLFCRRKEYDDNPDKQVLSLTIEGVKRKNENFGKMAEDFTGHQIVRKDDLVFTPRDFDATPILSGIAPCDGCISNLYFVLYPRTPDIDVNFYNYFMWGVKWGGDIWKKLSYGMRFSYNYDQFCALPAIKIPLSEQKVIADYLDNECARIDNIVEKQRNIIEKLKEYKKSVITEAVTKGLNPNVKMKNSGIEWIGDIPEHWEVRKFKYQNERSNTGEGIDKVFWTDDVKDDYFYTAGLEPIHSLYGDFPNWKYTQDNDLLLARNGTPYVYIPYSHAMYSDHIIRTTIKQNTDKRFVRYALQQSITSVVVDTVSITTWSISIWNEQKLPFPSLSEQQAIADYLDQKCAEIDSVIEKREKMIDLLTEYKKSLIYECVTGKKEVA